MRPDRDIGGQLRRLGDEVVENPGQLSHAIRKAALSGADVPPEAQTYIDKVRRHAYKVTDREVEELKSADWSEDQIFEITVAAAMGVGLSRLDRIESAFREAGSG